MFCCGFSFVWFVVGCFIVVCYSIIGGLAVGCFVLIDLSLFDSLFVNSSLVDSIIDLAFFDLSLVVVDVSCWLIRFVLSHLGWLIGGWFVVCQFIVLMRRCLICYLVIHRWRIRWWWILCWCWFLVGCFMLANSTWIDSLRVNSLLVDSLIVKSWLVDFFFWRW